MLLPILILVGPARFERATNWLKVALARLAERKGNNAHKDKQTLTARLGAAL